MTTAFVLSGGASLGAAQVGMLQALSHAGVRPDLLVGTSVGALNAAWVAGDPTPEGIAGLAAVWCGLRRDDVFSLRPPRGLLGFAGRRRSLLGDALTSIAASAAIPGIFPPATVNGRPYMDGGIVNNTPISHAVRFGADTVWVLAAG